MRTEGYPFLRDIYLPMVWETFCEIVYYTYLIIVDILTYVIEEIKFFYNDELPVLLKSFYRGLLLLGDMLIDEYNDFNFKEFWSSIYTPTVHY